MERAEVLQNRIALLRRYLREGAAAHEAAFYLKQIQQDEAELAALAAARADAPGGAGTAVRRTTGAASPDDAAEEHD